MDKSLENDDSVSERAKRLLGKDEGYDVDFKRDRNGLKSEDLVSFANSINGGTILIGIAESITEDGKQCGKIVGCKISDSEKLAILGKATECRPPVDIEIFVEGDSTEYPFYRVEIPSGQYKPYCTGRGMYMIRGDARNNPLTPEKLLDVFLEVNGNEFINRFKQATNEIDRTLVKTREDIQSLNSNVNNMLKRVNDDLSKIINDMNFFTKRVHNQLDDIFSTVEDASDSASDANSEANDINSKIDSIEYDIEVLYWLTRGIHTHLNLENPLITKNRSIVKNMTTKLYKMSTDFEDEKSLKQKILMNVIKHRKIKMEESLIEQWIDEQLLELK